MRPAILKTSFQKCALIRGRKSSIQSAFSHLAAKPFSLSLSNVPLVEALRLLWEQRWWWEASGSECLFREHIFRGILGASAMRWECKRALSETRFPTGWSIRKWDFTQHFSGLIHEFCFFLPRWADQNRMDFSCSILAEAVFVIQVLVCFMHTDKSSLCIKLREGQPEEQPAKWAPWLVEGSDFKGKPHGYRASSFSSGVFALKVCLSHLKTHWNIRLCIRSRNKRQYFNMLKESCQPVISINPSQLLETMYSAVVKRYSQSADMH